MYFTATDQNCVFAINLAQCIQTANVNSAVISNYTKFKIVQEVGIIDILASNSRLIALCFDYNLRVWDTESNTALRGATI